MKCGGGASRLLRDGPGRPVRRQSLLLLLLLDPAPLLLRDLRLFKESVFKWFLGPASGPSGRVTRSPGFHLLARQSS